MDYYHDINFFKPKTIDLLDKNASKELFRNSNNIFSVPVELVFLTLPYKPTSEIVWQRTANNFTLSIASGVDAIKRANYGLPYGLYARHLLYHVCTEVTKTKKQSIQLGVSYGDIFNRMCGYNKKADGRTINIFKEQVLRLFNARILLQYSFPQKLKGEKRSKYEALNLMRGMEFWSKGDKFNFDITLSQEFYDYLMDARIVPFDYSIIHALRSSPMLLDVYIFLNYKAFVANFRKENIFVAYDDLYEFFGTIASKHHFKANLKKNMKKLLSIHKNIVLNENVFDGKDGILISKYSTSNVTQKENCALIL